jgi:hypothetical protein
MSARCSLLLWLLGVAGQEGFGWASPDTTAGKTIFIAASVGIGAVEISSLAGPR